MAALRADCVRATGRPWAGWLVGWLLWFFPAAGSSVWQYRRGTPWEDRDYLLALVADELRGANWQRGGDKGAQPKPIPRPGAKSDDEHFGDPIPLLMFDDWWNSQ